MSNARCTLAATVRGVNGACDGEMGGACDGEMGGACGGEMGGNGLLAGGALRRCRTLEELLRETPVTREASSKVWDSSVLVRSVNGKLTLQLNITGLM